MKKHLRFLPLLATLTSLLLLQIGPLATAKEQERPMIVGKKGVVTFYTETKVGDLVLKPGIYRVQHRTIDSEHFMEFTRADTYEYYPEGYTWHIKKAKCVLELLENTVSQTVVLSVKEDGFDRIIRIKLKGENVVHHLF